MQACSAGFQVRAIGGISTKSCRIACSWRRKPPSHQAFGSAQTDRNAASSSSSKNNSSLENPLKAKQDKLSFPSRSDKYNWSKGARLVQDSIPSDLPIPPMFTEAYKPKLGEIYTPPKPQSLHRKGNAWTDRWKALRSPFSTALNDNPYAHALATPLRHCTLTNVRVPRSCLLDFHVVDTEENGKPSQSLLPLSLAAVMTSKKKPLFAMTEEQRLLSSKWKGEVGSREATGVASYVSGHKSAIELITSQNKWQALICSRRLMIAHDKVAQSLKWRADMPEFVLQSLRKIVIQKLRFFLLRKVIADNPGLVCEQPGGGSNLTRVNHVDRLSCVVRLRASEKSTIPNEEHDIGMESVSLAPVEHQHSQKYENVEATSVAAESELGEIAQVPEVSTRSTETESTPWKLARSKSRLNTRISPTHKQQDGYWVEHASESPFVGAKPLPPPRQPLHTYYPTIRYRNRRVPLYNLDDLLGTENLEKLLHGTAFEDSSYVMVLADQSTVDLQIWLMKLHTYTAGTKKEMLDRRG